MVQFSAFIESSLTDAGHTAGDADEGQADTILESSFADTDYVVGDGDGGQAAAPSESLITDTSHAVGDGGVFTSYNQRIGRSMYNGITVTTRIKNCTATLYDNVFEAEASRENLNADASQAVGNSDGGQFVACKESLIADTSHAVGDGDGRQAFTI